MMNKLPTDPRLPNASDALTKRLHELFRNQAIAHNESYFWETNGTSAPTTGTWAQGDKCRNNTPTELGVVTQKYLIIGWCCTVSGTPGTWLNMRTLTGN